MHEVILNGLVTVRPEKFLSDILDTALQISRADSDNFRGSRGAVIALVGAGGKTSLMYALAEFACSRGLKTLVTTTTHIMRPIQDCASLDDCAARWSQNKYAVWGTPCESPVGQKLTALSEKDFSRALECAEIILVEADGARRLSCKAPADHEPQIPREADLVIGVIGLRVLGQPIRECCFRPELVAAVLSHGSREQDHRLTPDDLVTLLSSERGTRKCVGDRAYLAVLNQYDVLLERDEFALGEKILSLLSVKNIPAALTCFA